MSQSKQNFANKLKHGTCGGRKQLHNARIHPHYCVNENAGTELHGCPDLDTFFVSKTSKCNCCSECKSVCELAAKVRSENTIKDIYNKWKTILQNEKI